MDHQRILRDISTGSFSPVYLLHGEESYFIDLICDAVDKQALSEEEKAFNQVVLHGKDVKAIDIIGECKQLPVMSERRVVIVREAQQMTQTDGFETYMENPVESTILVLAHKHKKADKRKKWVKLAEKGGVVFQSDPIKDYKVADWIESACREKGLQIEQRAALLVAEFLGTDLSKISHEIDKLKVATDETKITPALIEKHIGISRDYNPFELADAVSRKDKAKAFRIVEYFSHNPKAGPMPVVVASLFNTMSKMMRVHFLKGVSEKDLAVKLKLHPYVAKQLKQNSTRYTAKQLARNIRLIREADARSKGVANPSTPDSELLRELVFALLN